jgi:RND family efflux transporter MFP subunit
LLVVALAGCGAPPPPEVAEAVVRPVKTVVVGSAGGASLRQFPGRIEAARRAELGFRVPGTVREILFKEGDRVAEGAVLARLDDTDFRIVLRDRQASFDTAERNFARAKELITAGNISRYDYDRTESAFRSAEAALSQARQDLGYTELRAPFAGVVAKRHVENFEEVAAKATVFSLQQLDSLDVKVDLPERLLRTFSVSRDPDIKQEGGAVRAWAEFEGIPGKRFPLSAKEIATKADPKTQTFEVTLGMANPAGVVVLPGMTVNVTADFSGISTLSGPILVPASAVVADPALGSRVWLLAGEPPAAAARAVRIGAMQGSEIEVLEGLEGGEEIVAVGAYLLHEGMAVTRMPAAEQAEPSADEPH